MWIVPKGRKGDRLTGLRSLSEKEKRLFILIVKHQGTHCERILGRNLLASVHERDCWIECDCRASGRPLMAPVRKANGTLILRRMPSRYYHDEKCPFKDIEYQDQKPNRIFKPVVDKKELNLHLMYRDRVDVDENINDLQCGRSGSKLSTLARVLYTWLDAAKWNEIGTRTPLVAEQYKNLYQAVHGFSLAKGIPVTRFFSTFPMHHRSVILSLKDSIGEWPALVRPYAIFVVAANGYSDKKLSCGYNGKSADITFAGPVHYASMGMGKNPGPLVAIFTLTNSTMKPNYFEPWKAFIRPIYSKQILFPIDSRYERLVFEELLQWLPWWKEKGLEIKIRKPLFSLNHNSNDSIPLIPDFVFEAKEKKVFLEVMGSNEEEYRERKEHVIPLMSKLGEVFEFNAFAAEKTDTWEITLRNTIRGISRSLF